MILHLPVLIFELVQKLRASPRPIVRDLKRDQFNSGEFQFVFTPHLCPKLRLEDLVESDLKPIEETPFGPAFPHSLDTVRDLAEGTLDRIGIERDDFPSIKPTVKESGHGLDEVLNITPRLGISLFVQSLKESLKALLSLIGKLLNQRPILRAEPFPIGPWLDSWPGWIEASRSEVDAGAF